MLGQEEQSYHHIIKLQARLLWCQAPIELIITSAPGPGLCYLLCVCVCVCGPDLDMDQSLTIIKAQDFAFSNVKVKNF